MPKCAVFAPNPARPCTASAPQIAPSRLAATLIELLVIITGVIAGTIFTGVLAPYGAVT